VLLAASLARQVRGDVSFNEYVLPGQRGVQVDRVRTV